MNKKKTRNPLQKRVPKELIGEWRKYLVLFLLLAITMVVILLVTILTERALIAGEVTQIALQKAIGFSDRAVIGQHIGRFAVVGVVSALLSAALSIPLTRVIGNPIFEMTGKSDVAYKINVLKTFCLYPGAVLLATILATAATALYTRKITAKDTANIE